MKEYDFEEPKKQEFVDYEELSVERYEVFSDIMLFLNRTKRYSLEHRSSGFSGWDHILVDLKEKKVLYPTILSRDNGTRFFIPKESCKEGWKYLKGETGYYLAFLE